MGFLRFRRSIGLGRFLRLSVSKTGASVSLGRAPFTVNLRGDKVRETVGVPGTGLSYRTTSRIDAPADPRAGAGLGLITLIVVFILVALFAWLA